MWQKYHPGRGEEEVGEEEEGNMKASFANTKVRKKEGRRCCRCVRARIPLQPVGGSSWVVAKPKPPYQQTTSFTVLNHRCYQGIMGGLDARNHNSYWHANKHFSICLLSRLGSDWYLFYGIISLTKDMPMWLFESNTIEPRKKDTCSHWQGDWLPKLHMTHAVSAGDSHIKSHTLNVLYFFLWCAFFCSHWKPLSC